MKSIMESKIIRSEIPNMKDVPSFFFCTIRKSVFCHHGGISTEIHILGGFSWMDCDGFLIWHSKVLLLIMYQKSACPFFSTPNSIFTRPLQWNTALVASRRLINNFSWIVFLPSEPHCYLVTCSRCWNPLPLQRFDNGKKYQTFDENWFTTEISIKPYIPNEIAIDKISLIAVEKKHPAFIYIYRI